MKFKYFLRGLGVGIIFASIVCLMAFQGEVSDQMTDAEIIEKAKELGMTEQEDQIGDLLKDKENTSEQEDSEQNSGDTTDAAASLEEQTTQAASTAIQEQTTEEKKTTEKNTENKKNSEKDTVELTIERGSSSYPVCQKLQELGMIKDASEFDTYLVENGYASRIRVGTHKLDKGMSFKEIAEAISDPL